MCSLGFVERQNFEKELRGGVFELGEAGALPGGSGFPIKELEPFVSVFY